MELDDFKKKWKETTTSPSTDGIKEAIEKKISSLEKTGRNIRMMFYMEVGVVILIYAAFLFAVWTFQELITTYMYKIVIATTIPSIPIIYRLYKAQKWINSMDYTMDVRSNIIAFLSYYKRALWLYERGMYVTVLIVLALLFTDREFIHINWRIQAATIAWLILAAAIVRPYVRIVYGKKLPVFEDFLKE